MIIATRTVTVNPVKGRPIKLNKGVEVKRGVMNRLTARQQRDYTEVVVKTRRTWTEDEIELIASLYHNLTDASNNGENAADIIAAFRDTYDTHTDAAIIMMIGQCKAVDSYYDAVGLNVSKALICALENIDNNRYGV